MNLEDNMLLQEKPTKILLTLRRNSMKGNLQKNELARETDTTKSHTMRTIDDMEEQGLVKQQKQGRSKKVSLTKKGKKVSKHLAKIGEIEQ